MFGMISIFLYAFKNAGSQTTVSFFLWMMNHVTQAWYNTTWIFANLSHTNLWNDVCTWEEKKTSLNIIGTKCILLFAIHV